MNFSEIAKEDDKDEDKASLPDTEVGEVEDFTQQQLADFEAENEDEDEDEPESKKPKYSAVVKKRIRPKVNSVLYIQAGERDRAPIGKGAVSFCDFLVCEKNIYTICVKSKSKSKKLCLFRSYPT